MYAFYLEEKHLRPFTRQYSNGEWLPCAYVGKEVSRTHLLDQADRLIKSSLHGKSPLDVSTAIGGPLEYPDAYRYKRLFDFFAPIHWQLTVTNAQLKRTLPEGWSVSLNSQLDNFLYAFAPVGSLNANDHSPIDFRHRIEQSIFDYLKNRCLKWVDDKRQYLYSWKNKQTQEITRYFTQLEGQSAISVVAVGTECDKDLTNKTHALQRRYRHLSRKEETPDDMRHFCRIGYHPDYGRYVFVHLTVKKEYHNEMCALVMRLFKDTASLFEPNVNVTSNGSLIEYLNGMVTLEALVKAEPDTRDRFRYIRHSH